MEEKKPEWSVYRKILRMVQELHLRGYQRIRIAPDPHGEETWDEKKFARIHVHIVNSEMYREITGMASPPTPVTPRDYAKFRLPWFDLYNEKRATQLQSGGGRVELPDVQMKLSLLMKRVAIPWKCFLIPQRGRGPQATRIVEHTAGSILPSLTHPQSFAR